MQSLGLMGFLGFTDLVITGIDASFQSITRKKRLLSYQTVTEVLQGLVTTGC